MTKDVYRPQTITDQPFIGPPAPASATKSATSVYYPAKVTSQPLTTGVVASAIINRNLNTQSRKILGSFTFGKLGAIQIGNYSSGVSGDIRITPNGVVGRNSAGTTTFSIDGTTGNATFLGTIAAGSVISTTIAADKITGQIVNAQIANIEWAKIDSVVVKTADIENGAINNLKIGDGAVRNIHIQDATIQSAKIASLNADKINVGTLNGFTITGSTVTGGTVQTASSGTRVVISSAAAGTVNFYDSGSYAGSLSAAGSGNFTMDTNGILKLTPGSSYYVHVDGNMWLAGNDIDMNDGYLNRVNRIVWDTRSDNPSDNWCIYAYNSGGTYQLRVRLNGSTYSADLSSV